MKIIKIEVEEGEMNTAEVEAVVATGVQKAAKQHQRWLWLRLLWSKLKWIGRNRRSTVKPQNTPAIPQSQPRVLPLSVQTLPENLQRRRQISKSLDEQFYQFSRTLVTEDISKEDIEKAVQAQKKEKASQLWLLR